MMPDQLTPDDWLLLKAPYLGYENVAMGVQTSTDEVEASRATILLQLNWTEADVIDWMFREDENLPTYDCE
jgi:hypothetical protein